MYFLASVSSLQLIFYYLQIYNKAVSDYAI